MYTELLGGDQECGGSDNSSVSFQINLYLSEPVITQSRQPLVYWQNNKSCFPALAQAGRNYLCSPCTSVHTEWLFSRAGNIIDEKRNKLSAKNDDEMLIFIKKNLPLMLKLVSFGRDHSLITSFPLLFSLPHSPSLYLSKCPNLTEQGVIHRYRYGSS